MIIASGLNARTTPRAGLGEAGARLATQRSTIAYMGASVTEQRRGYRPLLHEAILRRFPPDHRSVNGSVGGVGAVSAVFLMDLLVLPQRPDICIVEYSTGDMDSESTLDEVSRAVEGIVCKLRDAGCAPLFLHLYRAVWNQRCDDVVATWEEVADDYGVPSIDLASPLSEAIDTGRVSKRELLRDIIHTSPAGSELVADLVDRALAEVVAEAASPVPRSTGELRPRGPSDDEFRTARVIEASVDDAGGAGSGNIFRFQLPYVALGPGEPITRTLPGELVGLVVLLGPSAGEISVRSAGAEQSAALFDEYCFYQRMSAVLLEHRCAPGAEVTIELTDAPVDRSITSRPIPRPEDVVPSLDLIGYMVRG